MKIEGIIKNIWYIVFLFFIVYGFLHMQNIFNKNFVDDYVFIGFIDLAVFIILIENKLVFELRLFMIFVSLFSTLSLIYLLMY